MQCCQVLHFPCGFSLALSKVKNSSKSEQHFRASTDMNPPPRATRTSVVSSKIGQDAQVPMNPAASASVHT